MNTYIYKDGVPKCVSRHNLKKWSSDYIEEPRKQENRSKASFRREIYKNRDSFQTQLKMKKCAYCKSKENLTIDHKQPLSKKGTNNLSNLQVLCANCNCVKSDLSDGEIRKIIKWYLGLHGLKPHEFKKQFPIIKKHIV